MRIEVQSCRPGRVRAARLEAASGQGSAAVMSVQVAGPDATPASSSTSCFGFPAVFGRFGRHDRRRSSTQ